MVDAVIKRKIDGHLSGYDYLGRVKAAFVRESPVLGSWSSLEASARIKDVLVQKSK